MLILLSQVRSEGIMLSRMGLAAAIGLVLTCAVQAQDRSPVEVRHIEHQGVAREFTLYRPAPTIAAGPRPLVVILHGLGGNASRSRTWGYEAVADREGFIVAYPQGIDNMWRYGRSLTDREMPRVGDEQVDDVGFLGRLVDTLASEQLADPSRLYLVGVSNGGVMAYTAACAMARRLAAVAALLSSMTSLQIEDCKPDGTISILALGGTADRSMPYAGIQLQAGSLVSVPDTVEYWRHVNKCGRSEVTPVPHRNANDPTSVTVTRWSPCADGVEVASYRVEGGGHRAPSLAPPADAEPEWERIVGAKNRDIETADEVWNFFRRFSRP
jgi:polyhydroxybutyrate depolymerase